MSGAADICELGCPDKHVYHVDCVKEWTQTNSTCPICEHNIEDATANA